MYTWGAGSGGKLGTGETSDALLPVKVNSLKHVKDIAAGKSISAALTGTTSTCVCGIIDCVPGV